MKPKSSSSISKQLLLNKENTIMKINISKYPMMAINIIIYVIILVYIFQMNSKLCRCASNWKKEFIKYFSFYAILRTILAAIYSDNIYQKISSTPGLMVFPILDAVLFLSFLIIILTYIAELKKNKRCLCSKNWKREFMWVLAWILIALLGISYIWFIVAAPIVSSKLV